MDDSGIVGVGLAHQPAIRLKGLLIEPALCRMCLDDGREELIQPRIMQVLVALLRANGRILTRDELTADCWGGLIVGEDAINRAIGRIRRLSEGLAKDCFTLETIPRVGYRLTPASGAAELSLVAAVSSTTTELEPARPERHRPTIWVLPFINVSDDARQEYFSDGITEDIITDLSKVSALGVVSRNLAFSFKSRDNNARQTAQALKVSHILEGSVRRVGERVRITAQLSNMTDGDNIWAERWDRDLVDIFSLQDEISHAIVAALRVRLLPEEATSMRQRGTSSPEAFTLYLQARQAYVSGCDRPRGALIIDLCRRALDLDPAYARAWSLMALAHAWSDDILGAAGDEGIAAAERALRLDANLADAHAAKARLLAEDGFRDAAFREIQAALALDAQSYEANETAGLICYRQGRMAEAIGYFQTAEGLMDTAYFAPGMLTCCYAAIGDDVAMQRAARRTVALAEAVLTVDQRVGGALGFLVIAYAALGEAEWARAWIARALRMDPDNPGMRYNFACALSRHLRDGEGAIDLLGPFFERTAAGFLTHAKTDPDLELARQDPRFAAMIQRAEDRLAGRPAKMRVATAI